MQSFVQSSIVRFGLLAASITASGLACSEGPLSDQEMSQLRAFTLPADPPSDPSNMYAGNLEAAKLGKRFYFDGGYSGKLQAPYNVAKNVNGALGAAGDDKLVSCASCHDPATGGADRRSQPNATSLGAAYTGRNAPTVINAAYSPFWQFWDGRVDSLWSQALAPPEGGAECNSNRLRVVHFIYDNPSYRTDFRAVFGMDALPDSVASLPSDGLPGSNPDPSMLCTPGDPNEPFGDAYDCLSDADQMIVDHAYADFGKAIAAYEGMLVSQNFEPSPFDRFMAGEKDAMSPAAIRGASLFIGHAGCAECHNGPTFTDHGFHNIGAPQAGEYVKQPDNGRSEGVVALTSKNFIFNRSNANFSDDTNDTTYIQALSGPAPSSMIGQFKTPTLRNVSKTAPYMHDGYYATLWDVVNHYNFGGATGSYTGEKDPTIAPLMLTDAELGDLVEFLRALDDGPALPTDDFPDGLIE